MPPGTKLKGTFGDAVSAGGIYSASLFALLGLALWLAFSLLSPFMGVIIAAVVIAVIFHPLQQWLLKRTRLGPRIIAGLVTTLIVFCLLIPFAFIITGLASQAVNAIGSIRTFVYQTDFEQVLSRTALDEIIAWLNHKLPFVDLSVELVREKAVLFSQQAGQYVLELGSTMASNVADLTFRFFLVIVFLFFFLLGGERMLDSVKYYSPLKNEQMQALFDSFSRVTSSVVVGGLLVAGLQGALAIVAFAWIGAEALFWGAMTGFAALVPVLGTTLVWVPVTAWLAATGAYVDAAFFAGWMILVVGSVDNFVRPWLMQGRSGMSMFLLFIAIIGGMNMYGPQGLLYGPLILSFALVMLQMYSAEFEEALHPEDASTTSHQQPEPDAAPEPPETPQSSEAKESPKAP